MKLDIDKMVHDFHWAHGPAEDITIDDNNMGYLFRWAIDHHVPTICEQIENLREEFRDKAAMGWKHPLDASLSPDDGDNRDIEDACTRALALLNKVEDQIDLIDESEASIATRRNSS